MALEHLSWVSLRLRPIDRHFAIDPWDLSAPSETWAGSTVSEALPFSCDPGYRDTQSGSLISTVPVNSDWFAKCHDVSGCSGLGLSVLWRQRLASVSRGSGNLKIRSLFTLRTSDRAQKIAGISAFCECSSEVLLSTSVLEKYFVRVF
jgi:hypothetical protein